VDVFDTEKTYYIVLELYVIYMQVLVNSPSVTGGELFDYISEKGPVPEPMAK
jgi:hypothetical protein